MDKSEEVEQVGQRCGLQSALSMLPSGCSEGVGVFGRQLPASCPEVVTGGLCLPWKAKSVNPLVSIPSLLVLSTLGWLRVGSTGASVIWFTLSFWNQFPQTLFSHQVDFFFFFLSAYILLPSSPHTLVTSTKNERRGVFSCG